MFENYKVGFFAGLWWDISEFFKNWIYPAYYTKNWLFNRYDIVRMPEIKRYNYCDVVERMFYANMNLIVYFMEEEKPEDHVIWYKGDDGYEGPKYGEFSDDILFPEYKGKFIMDIIKEIYDWYKVGMKEDDDEYSYMLDFWCKYYSGKSSETPVEGTDLYKIDTDYSNLPKNSEFFEDKNINWFIIDKFVPERAMLWDGNEKTMHDILNKVEERNFKNRQKYLHLAIEMRQYLWT